MDFSEQIERIKTKLILADISDAGHNIYGANSHKYILHDPVSIDEVEAFEKQYGVELPIHYKVFVTCIGNGGVSFGVSGAGPEFGLYPFGKGLHEIVDADTGYMNNEFIIDPEITADEWLKMYKSYIKDDYNKGVARLYGGILPIGYAGGIEHNGLILNGKYKGKLININEEVEHLFMLADEDNFLDWYENWLDEILSGSQILFDSACSWLDSNVQLEDYFRSKDQKWKINILTNIRLSNSISEDNIKKLREELFHEDIDVQYAVFQLLIKFDYEFAKPHIYQHFEDEPFDAVKLLHWFAPHKSVEWTGEYKLILQEDNLDPEVLLYIGYLCLPYNEKLLEYIEPFCHSEDPKLRQITIISVAEFNRRKKKG